MFKVYSEARLGPMDVSRLLRISRVTVSLWFNGHAKPHVLLRPRVDKLTAAVKSAVEAGDLPLSRDVVRRERLMKLQKIIAAHTTE